MSDFSNDAQTVDYEHSIQLNLLESLVANTRDDQDLGVTQEILDQYISFSEAHYMGEQLLMRLHAYPEYEEHTKQHDQLIESCAALRQALQAGDSRRLKVGAQQLKDHLMHHMEGSDRRLEAFLRQAVEYVDKRTG